MAETTRLTHSGPRQSKLFALRDSLFDDLGGATEKRERRVIPSALAVVRLLINFLVSVVYCGHGVARRQRNVIALGAHRRHS
jgi:hypothetical protein